MGVVLSMSFQEVTAVDSMSWENRQNNFLAELICNKKIMGISPADVKIINDIFKKRSQDFIRPFEQPSAVEMNPTLFTRLASYAEQHHSQRGQEPASLAFLKMMKAYARSLGNQSHHYKAIKAIEIAIEESNRNPRPTAPAMAAA